MTEGLLDWYGRLPKVELHLHLEGAIPLPALWALIEKYGPPPETPTLAALEERFTYRDFEGFLAAWGWKNRFLREAEDFTHIAAAVAQHLHQQNILYAECFFSPADFLPTGLSPGTIAEAIRVGLDEVGGTRINLVADLVRDCGPARGLETLHAVAELGDLGVIGIGIGGSEHLFPPEPFAPVYERARALGLRTSAHAGEAAGPASVWGALHALAVDRIGHGTRAIEDATLVEHLARTQVPIEACPVSNLRTGVISSLEEHPLPTFLDAGILVTVNTDDPAMFGTSLADEYRRLAQTFDFGPHVIRDLIRNAVEASWLAPDEQAKLMATLSNDPAWGAGPEDAVGL